MKTISNPVKGTWGQFTRQLLPLGLSSLVLAVVCLGCQPNANQKAEVNPVGTYQLVTVDGNKLPYSMQHEGASPTVKSGKFVINADGTCSSLVVFSLPGREDMSREVKASYTREGATLTMKWEGAGITTGTVDRDAFTMNNEGILFAYRK